MIEKVDRLLDEIEIRVKEIEKENVLYSDLPQRVLACLRELERQKNDRLHELINQLNRLIGLEEVKEEVDKMLCYLEFAKKLEGSVQMDNLNLHMVFKGNPGTGKTTVARIIANILHASGFTKSNQVMETTSKDFIGQYVGQTEAKTRKLIEEAKGGVIFIDEAYAFSHNISNDGKGYAHDAIVQIIKEMESKETIFIFAGYSKEMKEFLEMNPGLKSRIGYEFDFKDYSVEELLKMLLKKIKQSGFHIEKEAFLKAKEYIEKSKVQKNFGNGRMIDNLWNKMIVEQAKIKRNEIDLKSLTTITKEALEKINIAEERGGYFA